MEPVQSLAQSFVLYAGCCFLLYAACCWIKKRVAIVVSILGSLALLLWGLGFCAFAFVMGLDFSDIPSAPSPYPWKFVLTVFGIMLATFAMGGWLHRRYREGQTSWWSGVLFYALYFAAVFVARSLLSRNSIWSDWHITNNPLIPHGEVMSFLMNLLLWLFPIGDR